MPNCDWGKPCDCPDCRTTRENIICPNCQFKNVVDIVLNMDSNGYNRDRKGIGYYSFSTPVGKKDLTCYNCSCLIKDTIYFDELNKNACERQKEINELRKQGLFCQVCQKTEKELSSFISKLYKQENRHICHNCLFEEIEKTSKDPSNSEKKYYLNHRTLKWELAKFRVACDCCQRKRWLLAENAWKNIVLLAIFKDLGDIFLLKIKSS